jgi:hypothetical protein
METPPQQKEKAHTRPAISPRGRRYSPILGKPSPSEREPCHKNTIAEDAVCSHLYRGRGDGVLPPLWRVSAPFFRMFKDMVDPRACLTKLHLHGCEACVFLAFFFVRLPTCSSFISAEGLRIHHSPKLVRTA